MNLAVFISALKGKVLWSVVSKPAYNIKRETIQTNVLSMKYKYTRIIEKTESK